MTFFLQTSFTQFIFNTTQYHTSDAMIFLCNFSVVLALLLKITQVTVNCEECLQKVRDYFLKKYTTLSFKLRLYVLVCQNECHHKPQP